MGDCRTSPSPHFDHAIHLLRRPGTIAPRRAGGAFTLIELLVVISIVALLLSILLPALQQARNTATTMVCLNNQRQMGILTHSYQADFNGAVWPIFNTQFNDGHTTFHSLLGRLYLSNDFFAAPTGITPWNIESRQTPNWTVSAVFQCPRKQATQQIEALGQGAYSYTALPNDGRAETNAEYAYGANWNALKRYDDLTGPTATPWTKVEGFASDTFIISEHVQEWRGTPVIDDGSAGNPITSGHGFPDMPLDSYNSPMGSRRSMEHAEFNWWRHQGANFLFIDGSAALSDWGDLTRSVRTRSKD